ncbi:hypothetical protein B0H10DRAFT_1950227 [Mycena sp. CBHHK59/15]|nr:hypothetical protein B0H10DRAFT_1950227 [Mycena sp. CBHHK59/15]
MPKGSMNDRLETEVDLRAEVLSFDPAVLESGSLRPLGLGTCRKEGGEGSRARSEDQLPSNDQRHGGARMVHAVVVGLAHTTVFEHWPQLPWSHPKRHGGALHCGDNSASSLVESLVASQLQHPAAELAPLTASPSHHLVVVPTPSQRIFPVYLSELRSICVPQSVHTHVSISRTAYSARSTRSLSIRCIVASCFLHRKSHPAADLLPSMYSESPQATQWCTPTHMPMAGLSVFMFSQSCRWCSEAQSKHNSLNFAYYA